MCELCEAPEHSEFVLDVRPDLLRVLQAKGESEKSEERRARGVRRGASERGKRERGETDARHDNRGVRGTAWQQAAGSKQQAAGSRQQAAGSVDGERTRTNCTESYPWSRKLA